MRPLLAAVVALAVGCGSDSNGNEPTADAVEIRAVLSAVERSAAPDELREVDALVDEDLPVRAADAVRDRVLPALAADRTRLEALDPTSVRGRDLRTHALELTEARAEALRGYAEVLDRGLVEDYTLAQAIRAHREAEGAMLDFTERWSARLDSETEEP